MNVLEFKTLLNRLTAYDLDSIRTDLYPEFNSYPVWDTGAKKSQNIDHFVHWVRGNPSRVAAVVDLANKKLGEKAIQPRSGPVPNTHYITWNDFTKLPSYNKIAEAVEFRYDPASGLKNSPITKDGYVSVYAIYNMSAWASWKSSSLSDYERAKAEAVGELRLLDLMQLNEGRIKNQPALFPVGMLR